MGVLSHEEAEASHQAIPEESGRGLGASAEDEAHGAWGLGVAAQALPKGLVSAMEIRHPCDCGFCDPGQALEAPEPPIQLTPGTAPTAPRRGPGGAGDSRPGLGVLARCLRPGVAARRADAGAGRVQARARAAGAAAARGGRHPMTTSEQARADAIPYRCLDCDFEISRATRWWHQHQGHHTVGPLARGEADSYQARADALADAETWLTNLPPEGLTTAKLAQDYAEVARLWMLQGMTSTTIGRPTAGPGWPHASPFAPCRV